MRVSPEEFRNRLNSLLETARNENMSLTEKEIREKLADLQLNEEQISLVLDFFRTRKVQIRETVPAGEKARHRSIDSLKLDDREKSYLERYQIEMGQIPPLEEMGDEYFQLLKRAAVNPEARKELAELMLPDVLQAAADLYTDDVLLPDLVQEGNLQVVLAMEELLPEDFQKDTDGNGIRNFILEKAREGMRTLIEEQREVHLRDRRMVSRVQQFHDDVKVLKEELGRKVYLDEAADFMNISEEEAEDILRLSGEQTGEDSPEGSGEE